MTPEDAAEIARAWWAEHDRREEARMKAQWDAEIRRMESRIPQMEVPKFVPLPAPKPRASLWRRLLGMNTDGISSPD